MKGKILIIGDSKTNVINYGRLNKISSNSNYPILSSWGEFIKPGLANYMKEMLENLGFEVTCISKDSATQVFLYDIEGGNMLFPVLEKENKSELDINLPKVLKQFSAIVVVDLYNSIPIELYDSLPKSTFVIANKEILKKFNFITEVGVNEGINFLGRQGAFYAGKFYELDSTGNNSINILEVFCSVLVAASLASSLELSIDMATRAVAKELKRNIKSPILNWEEIMTIEKSYKIKLEE